MKAIDRKNWQAKTERLNANIRLKVGMEVVDDYGHKGIVVQISESSDDIEAHGCVSVWQMDRCEYGSDNCEHYTYEGWKSFLRVKMDLKHIVDLSKDCYFFDDRAKAPYIYKLKEIIDIHGDICIVTAESTAPECEISSKTLVFNLVTGKVLGEDFLFWQITNDSEWVKESILKDKETRTQREKDMRKGCN